MTANEQNIKYERHVVLVCPEVHWNTGNIGRTCLGTGTQLHLVKPLGFSLDSQQVKRAGLDYWPKVKLSVWDNFDSFLQAIKPVEQEIAVFAKKGAKSFLTKKWSERSFLIFGSETKGMPGHILNMYSQAVYHIPVLKEIRCLNLSTAVGIGLYESLRPLPPFHAWK